MRLYPFALAQIALVALLAAPLAYADPAPLPSVGVGVAIPLSAGMGGTLYVPVQVHPRIRVEPGVGLATTSEETKGKSQTLTDNATLLGLGVGVFYVLRPADATAIYLGPRLGVVFNHASVGDGTAATTKKSTDLVATLAVGGEHFLGQHFSLGAEAALGMAWLGQPTTTTTPAPTSTDPTADTSTVTQTAVSTVGSLFARFYF